jgi:hypothetical protein
MKWLVLRPKPRPVCTHAWATLDGLTWCVHCGLAPRLDRESRKV